MHDAQSRVPLVDAYFPAGHGVHAVIPSRGASYPALQSVQASALVDLPVIEPYVPLSQLVHHCEAGTVEYDPAAHTVQTVADAAPSAVLDVPGGQLSQADIAV